MWCTCMKGKAGGDPFKYWSMPYGLSYSELQQMKKPIRLFFKGNVRHFQNESVLIFVSHFFLDVWFKASDRLQDKASLPLTSGNKILLPEPLKSTIYCILSHLFKGPSRKKLGFWVSSNTDTSGMVADPTYNHQYLSSGEWISFLTNWTFNMYRSVTICI